MNAVVFSFFRDLGCFPVLLIGAVSSKLKPIGTCAWCVVCGVWRVGMQHVGGKRWFLEPENTHFSLEGRRANSNCAFTPASAQGSLSCSWKRDGEQL